MYMFAYPTATTPTTTITTGTAIKKCKPLIAAKVEIYRTAATRLYALAD